MIRECLLSAVNFEGATRPSSSGAVPKRNPLTQDQKLRRAAGEFESILIASFWKSMKESFSMDDDEPDAGQAGFEEMGIQTMSQALGKAGGFGLGQLIINNLGSHWQEGKQGKVAGAG